MLDSTFDTSIKYHEYRSGSLCIRPDKKYRHAGSGVPQFNKPVIHTEQVSHMRIFCRKAASTLFLPLMLAASAAGAHHSLVGEFDTSITFEVRGEITEVEWTNPHIWLYMDVADDSGEVVQWQCEMGSPNQLIRRGWRKQDLPAGTVIRARANPARDGTNTCSTRNITLDDGTPVFSRTGDR